jgi:NAD kinase
MKIEYAIVIKNKTRLETLIERFNTKEQARFYIERSGGNFRDYEIEHENFYSSLSLVQRTLSKSIKNKIVDRHFVPSYLFNQNHVIIVIGQDGLVANVAKYASNIPIIAINPDKERYDGILLPFDPQNFLPAIEGVINENYRAKVVSLAEAVLNDGQRLLAFNDLFIGAASHVSARYKISFKNKSEEHSSSGIIVSTSAGSTGWLSSVFNMTYGLFEYIERSAGRKKFVRITGDQLMFAVREPFLSKKTQIGIQAGLLTGRASLMIESLMPANGVIFSDGIESDFLKFNSGSIATIRIAKEKATLVVS